MKKRIKVVHSIPGRTRIHFPREKTRSHIEAEGRSCPGVYSATYSTETQSLLLYHYSFITAKDILFYLKELCPKPSSAPKENEARNQLQNLSIAAGALLFNFAFPTLVSGWRAFFSPTALVTLYLSKDVLFNGLKGIQKYKANADTLSLTAILASILQGNVRSALMITVLSSFGDYLAHRASDRTRNHITELVQSEAKTAWLVMDEKQIVKVAIEDVKAGDAIAVYDGERVPVDGKIISGEGLVDESSITGEFVPREVQAGSKIFAGTILKQGNVQIHAQKVGSETAIKQILHLVEEAHSQKAPIQLSIDRLANRLVLVSFLMATGVYAITRDWNRALNMLVIDFCCGLKLTSATAFSACIGKAARSGILIRGGQTVESLSKVETVVLDKTGTVTEGKPIVEKVIPTSTKSWKDILQVAASIEQYSSHPLADAIVNEARNLKVDFKEPLDLKNIPGKGIIAKVEGQKFYIGNRKLMDELLPPPSTFPPLPEEIENMITVFVADTSGILGIICITDQIRDGMEDAVNSLKKLGVDKIVLLTGDRSGPAQEAADSLNVDEVESEMLPSGKVFKINDLKENGEHVLMVGDGINDAPALAHANVGVSFGAKKTDIAVEASDITINSNDPMTLPTIYDLAKRTMKTVQQGITLVLVTNGAAMAAGALGLLSPLASAIVHNSATVLVVLNSARLYRKPLLSERIQKEVLKHGKRINRLS